MENESVLNKHSAASSAAGILFQFRRALLMLMMGHAGCQVGIEFLNDASIDM